MLLVLFFRYNIHPPPIATVHARFSGSVATWAFRDSGSSKYRQPGVTVMLRVPDRPAPAAQGHPIRPGLNTSTRTGRNPLLSNTAVFVSFAPICLSVMRCHIFKNFEIPFTWRVTTAFLPSSDNRKSTSSLLSWNRFSVNTAGHFVCFKI